MHTSDIIGHVISTGLEIRVSGDAKIIPNDLQLRINEMWEAALSTAGPTLFNGTLYSVIDIQPDRITVRPTEFKQFFAQNQDNSLFMELGIRPLACTGVVRCDDGLIFAKRSQTVMLNRGFWEIGPSGVFDDSAMSSDGTLCTQAVFTSELFEELGVPEKVSSAGDILIAFEDRKQHSVDLILDATVSIGANDVHEYFGDRVTDEYSEVKVVSDDGIRKLIAQKTPDILPLSLSILDLLGFDKACSHRG